MPIGQIDWQFKVWGGRYEKIPMCDLFYQITLYIARPLLETSSGNKLFFVVIDHYSKWCETCPMKEHDIVTITKFLEDKIIC
jgi:hypothetical protein